MPTTDKNGVVQLQTSDLIAPFQTTVNSVSGSISNVLTTLKKDIIYKATNQNNAITKKNALVEQGIVGTPNAPLLFYFTNLNTLYEWDGSSWNQIAPEPNTIVVDGVKYKQSGQEIVTYNLTQGYGNSFFDVQVITMPATPPSGWTYVFQGYGTGGQAQIVRVTGNSTNKVSVYMATASKGTRLMQLYWTLQNIS